MQTVVSHFQTMTTTTITTTTTIIISVTAAAAAVNVVWTDHACDSV
jgi:hypothetical protein